MYHSSQITPGNQPRSASDQQQTTSRLWTRPQTRAPLTSKDRPVPVVPLPAPQPAPPMCPKCECPVKEGVINYVKEAYDWQHMRSRLLPCPVCSADTAQRKSSQRELDAITKAFGEARIPWRMRDWSFDSFPPRGDQFAKANVQVFVTRHLAGDLRSKRFVYIGGQTGRGKTSLAVSALKVALSASHTGLYVLTTELMTKLRASFHSNSAYTEDELLQAITHVQWLVLDDLAVESDRKREVSEYILRSLYLIIQKRADLGLYTLITSNLSIRDLEAYWRPPGVEEGQFYEARRITERLREFCDGWTVKGDNLRG